MARHLELEAVAEPTLPQLRVLPALDRGLEWLEDAVLARTELGSGLAEDAPPFGPDPLAAFSPERLQGYARPCSFAAGEVLIAKGDTSDDVYILRSGSISIVVDGPDGGRVRLRAAGPGTVVGEIAFNLRRPRTAWAVADTFVTADRITRADVARMAVAEPLLLLAL